MDYRRSAKLDAGGGRSRRLAPSLSTFFRSGHHPSMPSAPLTHHEIIELMEPFTRRGWHVDLAASDRLERRLIFVSKPAPATAPPAAAGGTPTGAPRLREALQLESHEGGHFVLTRVSTLDAGMEARLEAAGSDLDLLLRAVESIDPQRHFRFGTGFVVAFDYQLAAPDADLVLTRGVIDVMGLNLTLKGSTVGRMPADFEIANAARGAIALPEDLLSVLGWDWSRLRRMPQVWRGHMRVRGREPERSRHAEIQLEAAARHLAQTLSEPPPRFHERWVRARWGVYLRRATPLLVSIGLIGAAAAVPRVHLTENSGLRMLIFNAPPLLMILVFCLRDIPSIEIPPWPRRSTAVAWQAE